MELREKIKKLLHLGRWSVRCERVEELIQQGWDIDKIFIDETSDVEKWGRKRRWEKYRYKIIGVNTYGPRHKSFIFVVEPIPPEEGNND